MATYDRRTLLRLSGLTTGAAALSTACSGSSLRTDDATAAGDAVKIGLFLPQTGVYKGLGEDARAGFDTYLRLNGGKLGNRDIELHEADEGDTQEAAQAAAEKLIKRDEVLVAVGTISSRNALPTQPMFTDAKIPMIGVNASPPQIQGKKYSWRTSFYNDDAGRALGDYVARKLGDRPISLIAADYQAGHDYVEAFRRPFEKAGGKVAGEPLYTPFPNKGSFQSYLTRIRQSTAEAVYCFFAGADAVRFVKEYDQFGLSGKYPLYAPGYLTEGSALEAQGKAAEGVFTSQNYSADLDNPENRTFVAEYRKRYDSLPSTYAMCGYDAALILDTVIEACGDEVTSERIEHELGQLAEVQSPRGSWRFGKNRSPVQMWYLREVRKNGDALENVIVRELLTTGDTA